MGETLFIAHRIPFPPDRGDKIRSHHLLKALAALGPVHVATLGDTESDFAAEPLLAEVATSHCLARRPASLVHAGILALASGKPVSLTAFDNPDLHAWIARTLAARPIETIFVFSGQMGQYVPASWHGRLVVDLCDVDSAKFEAYARERIGPRGWIVAREGRLLAAEEARLAGQADATLLITEAETAFFRDRIGDGRASIVAVGNGIDTALFDPQSVPPHAALRDDAGPHFVFTGQMDYLPNVAAAQRVTNALMPAIRAQHAAARFHIVGRAPAAEVRRLDGTHGTRVWGEVPDVRPFLAAADLVVAPLAIARGVQNKVLEAMAMARPVLLTPEAATGIDAVDGRDYAIADNDTGLVERACALLTDERTALAMGASARRFVVEHKSWAAALAPLAGIVGRASAEARDAA
jgi:sugar transferase (PEP-CTERM/EpsH1 system associated)